MNIFEEGYIKLFIPSLHLLNIKHLALRLNIDIEIYSNLIENINKIINLTCLEIYEAGNSNNFYKILQKIPYIKNLEYLVLGFDIENYIGSDKTIGK